MTLILNQCSLTILKILIPLRVMLSILAVFYKWDNKALITAHLFYNKLLNILGPLLRAATQEEKAFQNIAAY